MIDSIIMMLAVSISAYIETQQQVLGAEFNVNLLAEVNHHARGLGLGCTDRAGLYSPQTAISHAVEVIAPNMHELIVTRIVHSEVYTAQDVIHGILEEESEAYLFDQITNG